MGELIFDFVRLRNELGQVDNRSDEGQDIVDAVRQIIGEVRGSQQGTTESPAHPGATSITVEDSEETFAQITARLAEEELGDHVRARYVPDEGGNVKRWP